MKFKKICFFCVLIMISSCSKSSFLDKKPSSDITVPQTLQDLQYLLESADAFNNNGALGQLNGDEYQVTYAEWQKALTETERNSYIWASDLYGGDLTVKSWNDPYRSVFYANAILERLSTIPEQSSPDYQLVTGWAHFARAYAFYDLTRSFCKAYDKTTAQSDLGIPLRLSSSIDYFQQRASLQETYDQIFKDLFIAMDLLPSGRPSGKLNRPSKLAVHALLARIYLDMNNYDMALESANNCLNIYSKLINYNTINKTSTTPFSANNDELIYYAVQVLDYSWTTIQATRKRVSSELIALYAPNDIRLSVYYARQTDGLYSKKRNYDGIGSYPFTGLATDEIYLIKAECHARKDQTNLAMDVLNQLVVNRWNPDATVPSVPFQTITAAGKVEALQKVLNERRKELAWRGLRWFDLKRLNKSGANITLTRELNGVVYNLPPNDNRYVFPIPKDEIGLSNIKQNIR